MLKSYSIVLLLTIISLFFIPVDYSQVLCISSLVIYVLLSIFYLRKIGRMGIFSFDFFFLLGILLTCFVYPAFFAGIEILRAFNDVDDSVINKATVLSLVGAVAYMTGSLTIYTDKKSARTENRRPPLPVLKRASRDSLLLSCILFLVFLFAGGLNYKYAYNPDMTVDLSSALNVLDFFRITFLVLTVLLFKQLSYSDNINFYSAAIKINKSYLFILLFLMILLLSGGTRNLPIQIALMVIGLYNFCVKRITIRSVLLLIVLGFVFFSIIRISRENLSSDNVKISSGVEAVEGLKVIDLTTDLLLSSAPLYTLVSEADNNGLSYGKTMLLPILSIVPFAQYATVEVFNLNLKELEPTSMIATDLIYGSYESGAGTNIIGDIYYNFGSMGVVILMFLLGCIISYTGNGLQKSDNLSFLLVYAGFLSISFFFPRAEFCYGLRYIVWSLILMKLLIYWEKYLQRRLILAKTQKSPDKVISG